MTSPPLKPGPRKPIDITMPVQMIGIYRIVRANSRSRSLKMILTTGDRFVFNYFDRLAMSAQEFPRRPSVNGKLLAFRMDSRICACLCAWVVPGGLLFDAVPGLFVLVRDWALLVFAPGVVLGETRAAPEAVAPTGVLPERGTAGGEPFFEGPCPDLLVADAADVGFKG